MKRLFRHTGRVFAASLMTGGAAGSSFANEKDARTRVKQMAPDMDSLYASWMHQLKIPGMAYGIVLDGELVHAGYMGVQDHDLATPVTLETRFRIASRDSRDAI